MYEMLVGYPPFYSDDPMSTCRKVDTKAHCLSYFVSSCLACELYSSLFQKHRNLQPFLSTIGISLMAVDDVIYVWSLPQVDVRCLWHLNV